MRLIDADAFVQYIKDAVKRQKYENLKIDEDLTVADVLNAVVSDLDGTSLAGFKNAPTIEPERKGKWINVNQGKWNCGIVYKCSNCNEICHEMPIYADAVPGWDFCPNCGARMREGEQDE